MAVAVIGGRAHNIMLNIVLKSYAMSERQRRATDETNADARRSRDRGRAEGRNDAEQRRDAEP